MYDHILLPTDGSSGTSEALDHALSIAADNDATVHGLYVLDQRLYRAADDESKAEVIQSLEAESDSALAAVQERVGDAGVAVETTHREGIPHREILDYADAEGIDLIVMGTHGRTGPDRIANLGSTTERVVENGETPVLVVDIE